MLAPLAWVAVAWSVGAGCGVPSFACMTDNQCRSGSESGRCEPNGFCSFPDPTCTSGYRYGDHARDPLAGKCVGDVPAGEETGAVGSDAGPGGPDWGEATDGGPAEGSGEGSGDGTGNAVDGTTATADATDSGSIDEGTETGAAACPADPSEPNDDEDNAELVAAQCAFDRSGVIGEDDEADWYLLSLDPTCLEGENLLELDTAASVELCYRVQCPGGGTTASCNAGSTASGNAASCCDEPSVSGTLTCADGDTAIHYVSIESSDPLCAPYDLTFTPVPP